MYYYNLFFFQSIRFLLWFQLQWFFTNLIIKHKLHRLEYNSTNIGDFKSYCLKFISWKNVLIATSFFLLWTCYNESVPLIIWRAFAYLVQVITVFSNVLPFIYLCYKHVRIKTSRSVWRLFTSHTRLRIRHSSLLPRHSFNLDLNSSPFSTRRDEKSVYDFDHIFFNRLTLFSRRRLFFFFSFFFWLLFTPESKLLFDSRSISIIHSHMN